MTLAKCYRVLDASGAWIRFTHTGIPRYYLYAANAKEAVRLAKLHGHKGAKRAVVAA